MATGRRHTHTLTQTDTQSNTQLFTHTQQTERKTLSNCAMHVNQGQGRP